MIPFHTPFAYTLTACSQVVEHRRVIWPLVFPWLVARTRPVNPFRSFPRESHGLYSVTSKYDMDCGILIRGDDDIGG